MNREQMIAWLSIEGWEPVRPIYDRHSGWRAFRNGDLLFFVGLYDDYKTFLGKEYPLIDATDETHGTWDEYSDAKLEEAIAGISECK